MQNAHPDYRPDIDGLRAVAILSVIANHAFPSNLRGGFAGVDIFFVISGYLISSIIFRSLQRGDFSFSEFYARRIRRIFPALILVMVTSFTAGWFVLYPDEFKQLGLHIAAGGGFVQNLVLNQEAGYFDTASELKPLLHLWSLSIEEQFYLLFPLVIWFTWRSGLNPLSLLVLLGLVSFVLNVYNIGGSAAWVFFMPHTRYWELLAGALLAYLQMFKLIPGSTAFGRFMFHSAVFRIRPTHAPLASRRVNLLASCGLLLIVLAIFGLNKGKLYPGWWALFPILGASLIILAGPGAWVNRKILSNRVMVFVGMISYPLYLWHWPLLSFARIVESETPPFRILITLIVLSFVLAWLTYRLIERPLRFGIKKNGKTVTLCVLLTLVGYLGFYTYERQGLPFRKAATEATLVNKFNSPDKQSCQKLTGDTYEDDWCNAGNGSTITPSVPAIIMIGDSFSNTYTPTLFEYASSVKPDLFVFSQYARGQCPSLLDYGPPYCKAISTAAAQHIAQIPSVHTVILAANWPSYFAGMNYHWLGHQESADHFFSSFAKTVEHYQGLGKKVVVFLAPPQGQNPKSCIKRAFKLSNREGCQLPIEMANAADGAYREKLIPYLTSKNVAMFDPFKVLCDAQSCKMIEGQKIFYSDAAHISSYGGQYLAQEGQALLDATFSQ